MQKISLIILAIILAGTSLASDSALDRVQGCWKTDYGVDGISNTIVFCIDSESVEVSVFYPNHGHDSTTCQSSGQVESIDSTTVEIRTGRGNCENGNSLASSVFACTLLNEAELNCLDQGFNQLHFKREKTEAVER